MRGLSLAAAARRTAMALAARGGDGSAGDAARDTVAHIEARVLVRAAAGVSREEFMASPGRVVSPGARARLERFVRRRLACEPVARIVGEREFYSLAFALAPAVFDPRPCTETLVDAVLALSDRAGGGPSFILDLGAGSGCLLLSLLDAFPGARGVGVDIAPEAVAVAADNARRLGLAARALFVAGCWGAALADVPDGGFDLVVSNPPYIPSAALARLPDDVRLFDPPVALDGGRDGLAAVEALLPDVVRVLRAGGLFVLEMGAGQAAALARRVARAGLWIVGVRRDLAGYPRALLALRLA